MSAFGKMGLTCGLRHRLLLKILIIAAALAFPAIQREQAWALFASGLLVVPKCCVR